MTDTKTMCLCNHTFGHHYESAKKPSKGCASCECEYFMNVNDNLLSEEDFWKELES